MDFLQWLVGGTIPIGDGLSVPEVIGNVFGVTSAILGMRRWVAAWPIGLIGNVLLFFAFTTGELVNASEYPLMGQATRQIFFASVSVYGWWRWSREKRAGAGEGDAAIQPRWATWSERLLLLGVGAVAYTLAYLAFENVTWLASWSPATEAWILAGSLLASWGMARGWVEFWLVWIAVDLVGVISLVPSDIPAYATIGMYLFYAFFVVMGFFVWWRAADSDTPTPAIPDTVPGSVPSDATLAPAPSAAATPIEGPRA